MTVPPLHPDWTHQLEKRLSCLLFLMLSCMTRTSRDVLPVLMSPGVLCVDVSVEAELLVAGSNDGVVAVWSLADQELIHTLLGHTGQCDLWPYY